MRQDLVRHFDVVIVIWVLALAVGWTMVTLSRAPLSNDQWSGAQPAAPAWVVPADAAVN